MDCGSGHTWRCCGRPDFCARKRRSGYNGAGGWLSGDRRRGRGYYDARLLPGLRNDSSRRGRRRYRGTLTLATQIRTLLTRQTLAERSLRRGRWLGWCTRGRADRQGARSRTRHRRCRLGNTYGRAGSRAWRRASGSYRTSWNHGLGRLGLRCLGSRRPLGYRRSFIFTLLNCLEHVAGLRNARPVDLLLGLVVDGPRRAGAILPTTLKVLAHPLRLIFFQRAGVCFLLGHADVRQGIQDRPALHFQFAC
jgi:hypothetical protein